ncbi:MAG: FAD-dependent oxidoreductase [Phycisphaerae bacterium]|nr:FAD-dependent oxidoreductase [Phycisphaerae bacterium]
MLDGDLTSKDVGALRSTTELMEREWSPCRHACPVHADVRGYVELIARGRWQDAIDLIRTALPFAAVCGRICHHPCETNCRRHEVDQPVAVRELKRFVAELQGAKGSPVHKAKSQDKAKVAVIGAGPSGMSAALELAKLGYRPTIFEKFPIGGGIPATAIPKYRLPADVIQMDVEWILAHGVEMQTGVEIGKDKTIDDLRKEGFKAILVAVGLAKSRTLPLPGSDHKRVLTVMDFLTALSFDRKPDIGKNVLVIGGGNVAVDAARSAVRLGAEKVQMMCLENEEEMPAWSWEQRESLEEGISFIHRRGPVEIVVKDGKIVGMKARKVTRVFDESHRFSPAYDDSDVIEVACDSVIIAIGQMSDNGFAQGSDVTIDERGRLAYTPATQQTNAPDVFACGEVVTGPGSAVEACASGQRVAKAVDLYLSGKAIAIDDAIPETFGKIDEKTAEKITKTTRVEVPTDSAEQRKRVFAEFEHTLDEAAVLSEARRCMSCGSGAEVIVDKCAACLTCLRVCPFDIPKVTDVARIESSLCQACGMCIAECPANAIVSRGWDTNEVVRETAGALAGMGTNGRKKIVAYVCGHHAPANAWSGSLEDGAPGVAELYLPSMSRLGTNHMLKAFESGADGVIVVASEIGGDRYPGATERIRKRVQQVKDLLGEAGLSPEQVQLVEAANQGRAAMREAMAEAAEKISAC